MKCFFNQLCAFFLANTNCPANQFMTPFHSTFASLKCVATKQCPSLDDHQMIIRNQFKKLHFHFLFKSKLSRKAKIKTKMFHKFTNRNKNCITYLYIRKAIKSESYINKMFVNLRLFDITAHLTGIFQETLHIKKGHFWRGGQNSVGNTFWLHLA